MGCPAGRISFHQLPVPRSGGGRPPGGFCNTSPQLSSRTCPKDEQSWTKLIVQHTKSGQAREALRLYKEMQKSAVKPSSYTLVVALKACGWLQDLQMVTSIHGDVLDNELQSDIYVATTLVDVYAKCGSLVGARLVFEKMLHRNVVSWNAMISGYAQKDEGDEALKLYARMQAEGIGWDHGTFVGALKACTTLAASEKRDESDGKFERKRCLHKVRGIHSDVMKSGFVSNISVGSMLVDAYAKCGSLVDARHVFETMPHRNVVCWTALILGYAQMEAGDEALQLFERMQQEGVPPNDRTFVCVLKACSSLAVADEVTGGNGKYSKDRVLQVIRSIHSNVKMCGSESALFVGTMLVDVYAKCGSLVDARGVFDKMPQRNVVSWTAMILGYAEMDKGEEALHLFSQMQRDGVLPDDRTFVGALKACSSLITSKEKNKGDSRKSWCLQQVRAIHLAVVKNGLQLDLFVGNMLVDVYAKCGSLVDARLVFEKMPHRNVVSWTSMIMGYAEVEEGEKALQLYMQMHREGIKPDALAFVGALKACGSVAGLEMGKQVHADISEAGLENTHSFVASSLVDMYAKCGSMVDAQQVFDALPVPNVVSWNALIAGYARQGESEVVFDMFEKMKRGRTRPEGITFLSVLHVCSHAGLVGQGQKYFEEMTRDFGITPTVAHYTCMVDLLGRVGKVDDAMAIAKSMPCQSDIALWQTILCACRKWNHVQLGREAFELARRLDKHDAAAYVLMSSIYSAVEMWEEARNVQELRLKTRAWKQPGQSWWTDWNGAVHGFVVGDLDISVIQDLCGQLHSLCAKLEEERYMCLT